MPSDLEGLRGVLSEKARGAPSSDMIRILEQMTPEQRREYVNLIATPPFGSGIAREPEPEGLSLLDLLQRLWRGGERPAPAPALAPEPELEAPWMMGYESLPAPAPAPTPGPTPIPPMGPGDEVALLAEHLRKRREKMLPLQYLANPPPRR